MVFNLGRAELIIILVIVFFLLFGSSQFRFFLSQGKDTEKTFNKPFFIGIGVIVSLFALVQFWLFRL